MTQPETAHDASAFDPSGRQLPTPDVTAAVRDIFAEVLAMPTAQVGLEADFYDDLGGDSLQKLEVVTRFEAAFGQRLTDEQAADSNTVVAFGGLLGSGND